jgi:hypothetical protein
MLDRLRVGTNRNPSKSPSVILDTRDRPQRAFPDLSSVI